METTIRLSRPNLGSGNESLVHKKLKASAIRTCLNHSRFPILEPFYKNRQVDVVGWVDQSTQPWVIECEANPSTESVRDIERRTSQSKYKFQWRRKNLGPFEAERKILYVPVESPRPDGWVAELDEFEWEYIDPTEIESTSHNIFVDVALPGGYEDSPLGYWLHSNKARWPAAMSLHRALREQLWRGGE